MSAIYIIAGPPGIGKSTRGHEFIDMGLDILNEDECGSDIKPQDMPIIMNIQFNVLRIPSAKILFVIKISL
jgi:predicted ABC-type ATPase